MVGILSCHLHTSNLHRLDGFKRCGQRGQWFMVSESEVPSIITLDDYRLRRFTLKLFKMNLFAPRL